MVTEDGLKELTELFNSNSDLNFGRVFTVERMREYITDHVYWMGVATDPDGAARAIIFLNNTMEIGCIIDRKKPYYGIKIASKQLQWLLDKLGPEGRSKLWAEVLIVNQPIHKMVKRWGFEAVAQVQDQILYKYKE